VSVNSSANRNNRVAGGQISKSAPSVSWAARSASARASVSPSACRPFIFQLPAISGRGLVAMVILPLPSAS